MDNILVVDDEKNIRTLCARVLGEDQAIEVHGAGTGKEGLQMADDVAPDVVLLDLRLPDSDGMDVLRALDQTECTTGGILPPHVAHIVNQPLAFNQTIGSPRQQSIRARPRLIVPRRVFRNCQCATDLAKQVSLLIFHD